MDGVGVSKLPEQTITKRIDNNVIILITLV